MLKKMTSGFLILIVLVGTVGLKFDSHFCGGELMESKISFFPQNLSCGMKSKVINTDQETFSEVCCTNEHDSFQLDDDFVKHLVHYAVFINNAVIPEKVVETVFIQSPAKREFIGYSPPLIEANKIVLHQSFLI